MRTLYESVRGEYTEKKSRFIGSLAYVETEEEAEEFFAAVRREFYDARHNCTAFIINKEGNTVKRSSDDGEPQGTAGHPMLDVLENEGIVNIAAVVTRYFGGTLLGTGGLVRSYTKALQDALARSVFVERMRGTELKVLLDYQDLGKAEHFLNKSGYHVTDKQFGEKVELTAVIPGDELQAVIRSIDSLTSGKAGCSAGQTLDFALLDGKFLTGEKLLK